MIEATLLSLCVGAGAFAVGFALAWSRTCSRRAHPPSTLALESIARTLAADVRDHSGTVRSAESALVSASGDSVRECVRRIQDAGVRLQARLQEAEERLARQSEMLEQRTRESQVDALTQAFNRGALDERLTLAFEGKTARGRASALLMLDVDHFKRINDRFGHPAGDIVLKTVAKRIQDSAPAGSFVARYGGEEFAVLFEGATAEERRQASETIRAAVGREEAVAGERSIRISCSAGLADSSEASSLEAWIERADSALYFAKNAGRDRGYVRFGKDFVELTPAAAPMPAGGASRDAITGLLTRDAFASALDRAIADEQRGVILVAGLEGYSELIERRGFRAAEGALTAIATAMRSTVRDKDPAGRIGRASFAVLLLDASPAQAQGSVDRLRAAFASAASPEYGLSLTTANLDLDATSDGKSHVSRCVASLSGGWFPMPT